MPCVLCCGLSCGGVGWKAPSSINVLEERVLSGRSTLPVRFESLRQAVGLGVRVWWYGIRSRWFARDRSLIPRHYSRTGDSAGPSFGTVFFCGLDARRAKVVGTVVHGCEVATPAARREVAAAFGREAPSFRERIYRCSARAAVLWEQPPCFSATCGFCAERRGCAADTADGQNLGLAERKLQIAAVIDGRRVCV